MKHRLSETRSCGLASLPRSEGSGAGRGSSALPRRCGNDAPWKPWKSLAGASQGAAEFSDFSTVSTALGNRAQNQGARFPHSHSDGGGARSRLRLQGRRTAFGRAQLDMGGWLSRQKTPQPVGGEIFLLTSPFIEPGWERRSLSAEPGGWLPHPSENEFQAELHDARRPGAVYFSVGVVVCDAA